MDTLGDDGIEMEIPSDPWLKQMSGHPFTVIDAAGDEELSGQGLVLQKPRQRRMPGWWKWSYAWYGALFMMGISCGYLLQPLSSAKAIGDGGAPQPATSQQSETTAKSATLKPTATVDVQGDVRKPGVYQLAANARVKDAVRAAGGFLHEGDASLINLAAPVDDGAEVVVPAANNSATASNSSAVSTQATGALHKAEIDLNTADEASLETIPGIGPAKAAAIIQYRKAHGAFHAVKDLLNVSGIGQGTLAKLTPYLTVTAKSPS